MSEPTIEFLAERLGRLERECRRWRLLGGGGAAALAIVLLAGGAREAAEARPRRVGRLAVDELEARRIVLKDEADETWFKLERRDGVSLMSMLGEGVARLRPRLKDQVEDQRPQAQGGLAPVRPSPAQVLFVVNRGAVPYIRISGNDGGATMLGVDPDGEPYLLAEGKNGTTSIGGVGMPGRSGLLIRDPGGRDRIHLGMRRDGSAGLEIPEK